MSIMEKLKDLIDIGEDDEFEEDEFEDEEDLAEEPTLVKKAVGGASSYAVASAGARSKSAAAFPQGNVAASPRPKLTVHTTKTPELAMEIHVPSEFNHVRRIADDLLAERAAVVNFERVDGREQRRMIDFISGVSYVLDCEARRISDIMVLCVPHDVNVSTAKPKPVKK